MTLHRYDIIIAGAGIIGSAAAYSLSNKVSASGRKLKIAVIDLDLEGEFSSTLKNAGGVRATWRNRANIELCNFSIKFFESIRNIINFKQLGYFWLHNADSWKEILNNCPAYREYGIDVHVCEKKDVKEHLPFIDSLEDVEGLTISLNAGLIDHYSLRDYYRKIARKNGVEFIDRRFIEGIETCGKRVYGLITLDISDVIGKKGREGIKDFLRGKTDTHNNRRITYRFDIMVNATGAWADSIPGLYDGTKIMVKPRRRQLEVISCRELDLSNYGMIIDTSDVYFHKEGEYILVGYSNPDEPYGANFEFDFYGIDEGSKFVEKIWKPLWKRCKKFEKLKFIRGWSGLYGETSDRSGYLGKVDGFENVYESCGHTGRGLMISHGAAEALADLIFVGEFRDELRRAADLSRHRPNGPLYEQLHL